MEYYINPQNIKKSKLTLGYLDNNEYNNNNSMMLSGIFEAARKYDINLIRFGYYTSRISPRNTKQIEALTELVKRSNLDGLLFLGWTQEAESFIRDLKNHIPIISVGTIFEDIPNVFFPGHLYLRELLQHLVNVHDLKRIAYLAPSTPDGRNSAYIDTMEEYGIYDPDLYIKEKDLVGMDHHQRVKRALEILIDEKKVTFNAVVSLYKEETGFIIQELNSRGLKVPGDVAVTSYEDDDNGRFSVPSYTSIYFPWTELGFYSCEKMVELIREGHIPLSTLVYGEIKYRNSCGCRVSVGNRKKLFKSVPAINDLKNVNESEKAIIVMELESKFKHLNFDFEKLLNSFILDYRNQSYNYFLDELITQFKKVYHGHKYSDIEEIVMAFRNLAIPFIIHDANALLWSGNLFQKSQILIKEKVTNMRGYDEVRLKNRNQILQDISQDLITNFSLQNLLDSLGKNLLKLGIPSCHMFICESLFDSNRSRQVFENYILAFEFDINKNVDSCRTKKMPDHRTISDVLSSKESNFTVFAQLLHINNDLMGFILFEPGPLDERVYQILSTEISTALRGAFLLEQLEKSYKKLIDQAHREGMADIAAGILHNIGNAFSSVNSSVQIMRELINKSPAGDLKKANNLLEQNIQDVENFVTHHAKGKKLMQFYVKLGASFSEFSTQMKHHINRLEEKINSVDDMITAQQNYAGIESVPELLDIATVVEDVLKVEDSILDKCNVKVLRDYQSKPKVVVQRGKLFHMLSSLVKNAREALTEACQSERRIVIRLYDNQKGKYICISDNGCGIPPNLIEKIFTYGFSTKKGGQGLGLYSCASYMAETGGEIWAESEGPGKGAEIILHFQ